MAEKTMRDAINEALHQAMAEDDTVFVIGEDVAGCNGAPGETGSVGGVFGVTTGLYKAFGTWIDSGPTQPNAMSHRFVLCDLGTSLDSRQQICYDAFQSSPGCLPG